jgi:hypothetical protein
VDVSFRSCLTAGVAIITAAAIAFVPSVKEPVPAATPPQVVQIASPPIELAAQVQPTVTATNLPGLLVEWLQRIIVPPSAGQPFPTPQLPPVVAPTSIGSSIIGVYNAVEPWVRYGFDLAAYAVGWIPYVGWLAPQITIFYNFGERIARSITYNIANWLDGNISFGQGLVNVGIDTINSFIFLANDQLAFWLPPLPPIPPLPGIIFPFAATEATTDATMELTAVTAAVATEDATKVSAIPTDAPKLAEKQGTVKGEVLVEEDADPVTTPVATDEVTAKGEVEPKVDAVEAAEEAKATTSSSTGVAAQGEVRGAPNEKKAESARVNNGDKKGKKGDEAQAAEATSGAAASASTNGDAGAKRGKKDDTGKRE